MWLYKDRELTEEDTQGNVAFVYLITNLTDGRQYIGKKNLTFKRSKKVAGKTRRKRVTKESDWRTYWGSNTTLVEDVERLGQQSFKREVLHLCKTRGTASYLEMKEQVLRGVLETDRYYNDQIRARVHRSHLKF